MERVYISGPITGIKDYKRNFAQAVELLFNKGYQTINPAGMEIKDGTWEQYMRADLSLMLQCDSVYMLQGWKKSKGATIEHDLAVTLGMKVSGAKE